MPYAPRQYPLQPLPQGPDPLQSLAGLMSIANSLEDRKLAREENMYRRAERARVDETRQTLQSAQSSQLPPEEVKKQLTLKGRGDLVQPYEEARAGVEATAATKRRESVMQGGGGREAILKQLESDPDGYKIASEHFGRIDASYKQMMGDYAAGIRAFGDSPDAAMAGIDDLVAKGFDERKMERYRAAIQEPGAVTALVDALLKESPDQAHHALVTKPRKLQAIDPTHPVVDMDTGEMVRAGEPAAVKPPAVGSFEDYLVQQFGARPTPPQIAQARTAWAEMAREPNTQTGDDPQGGVAAPLDPESQDLMSQTGLSYNGFLALTGRMSQLARDKETRNRASAEVQAWARTRGMDVATLGSQYKAYNEALENNIARYNRTLLAEGEIGADVENLIGSVKTSGLGDVKAINAAKQWLKGELNDPNAAEYAFFLNQLVNDIALYNAASQGRAALQSDVEDAKSVVQRGVAAGSLTGMQKAITASVEKMGTVLEGAVQRSRKNVWDLFGVGDKYKPKTSGKSSTGETDQIIVTAPDGSTHPFATQAEADRFKQLAGIK